MLRTMTGDIRKHLEITPFVPFSVRTADGREYPVPTIDHIYLPPIGGRVIISDDEGVVSVLPGLLISGVLHATDSHGNTSGT